MRAMFFPVALLMLAYVARSRRDGDLAEMLQSSSALRTLSSSASKKELAQLLVEIKPACLEASDECLPKLQQLRRGIRPYVQELISDFSDHWEPNAIRADVVKADLLKPCAGAKHTMVYMHIWKSAGFALIRNVRSASRNFYRVQNNKTLCQEIEKIPLQHRSTFTFVREPLSRFISGYAEIEQWAEKWGFTWLTQYPKGFATRAAIFLNHFFQTGVNGNGHVRPQIEFLAPSPDSCPFHMDFIGRTEHITEDWAKFMESQKCSGAPPFNNGMGQHPTKDEDRLAMNEGLGLSFMALEAQSTLFSAAAEHEMRHLLKTNSSYLRAFCYISLPDYVTFDYDLPPECNDKDLLEIMALTKQMSQTGKPKVTLPESKCENCETSPSSLVQVDPPKVFVGVESGHPERRRAWRDEWHCGEQLRKAGIPYAFVVGWPVQAGRDLTRHTQGLQATVDEVQQAEALRNESEKYGDMHFIAVPDTYLDLQAKTFAIFQYGLSLGASYVAKLDDDNCMNATKLLESLQKHEQEHHGAALYGGYYEFKGTEYETMKGKDHVVHPYMSGPGYVLSSDLIEKIVKDDEPNSILWAPYGSFDEDAQTGRWVDYAAKHHNLTVNYLSIKGLLEYPV